MSKPTVVIAGLGDTGVMIATRLSKKFNVVAISTRTSLVSGQELGTRLTDLPRWKKTYLIPLRRFKRLDAVDVVHGKVRTADLESNQVVVDLADGGERAISYDYFIIATGVANGFWRTDAVQGERDIQLSIDSVTQQLASAKKVAIVGGGATGVSVADNLARTKKVEVHLFHSGDEPLPEFHPRVRRWCVRQLTTDGVIVHPNHRADLPEGFQANSLTSDPIKWSTGQDPFTADLVLWAVGNVRPFSSFLPSAILDDDGFVLVDENLRVPNHPNVFAVGDVAASDPLRSSARNWGHRVVVANINAVANSNPRKLQKYKPAPYRWGSILGLQPEGLTVVQPNGKYFRIPHWFAKPFLFGVFVQRSLYGGLRKSDR